ncbi:MAG TPA: hypothetical protein VEB66_07140 [Opitutaceae bacterium]|nr:hypothetical protein [Opitutaceae bacterium]
MCRAAFVLVVLLAGFLAIPAAARDVFVLLSGGDSPASNNYSQFLQARAVAKFFGERYPADSVWTFFGAGNVEGEPAFFGDVRRQVRRDGLLLESWLPGALPRNRPAKRADILAAFRGEILPAVRDGGTLYLFVGDHGSETRGTDRESVIDLWGIDRDPGSRRGWKPVDDEQLTVGELRDVLAAGLGRGRVVFCMTQCHSGGFHFLGVPREVAPNPAWFAGRPPAWLREIDADADLPAVAGYAATDAASLAAGCDPDPDPDRWAGYERFVPENLLGLDLFTLEPVGAPRESFHDAHVAATLVDTTIDKPYATSEQYLERWARLIETRLVGDRTLTPAARRAVSAYTRAVNTGQVRARDPALQERRDLFGRFVEQMTRQNPELRELLLEGSRAELERAAARPAPRGGAPTAQAAPRESPKTEAPKQDRRAERRAAWRDVVRPAWKEAVMNGEVPGLDDHALAFERHLLQQEDRGREYFFYSGWQNPLINEVFWNSGYHDPQTLNRVKAESVARWAAVRRTRIAAWADSAGGDEVRAAANRAFPVRRSEPAAVAPPPEARDGSTRANVSVRPLSRRTAAERTLFYRRTLAAWAFLVALNEEPALARVAALTALERTPLPEGR